MNVDTDCFAEERFKRDALSKLPMPAPMKMRTSEDTPGMLRQLLALLSLVLMGLSFFLPQPATILVLVFWGLALCANPDLID